MNKTQRQALKTLMRTDVYKTGHRTLYPAGLKKVFSNFTPRSGNKATEEYEGVIASGMRYVFHKIQNEFVDNFSELTNSEIRLVAREYVKTIKGITGGILTEEPIYNLGVYVKEHKKLPLEFRAVEEDSLVKFKVPVLTISNTEDKFAWLVNYLETWISSELWPIITASTKAKKLYGVLEHFAKLTGSPLEGVSFQAHDFVARSVPGSEAAVLPGLGHLRHFQGSDNLVAIMEAGVGSAVLATEHSIMSAGTKEFEKETYQRLLEDNPTGIISIVSDTWNIYNVMDKILPSLRDVIYDREEKGGQLVIRPDSGEPIYQLLGDKTITMEDLMDDKTTSVKTDQEEAILLNQKSLGLFGLVEKHFGATTNAKGFKVLPIKFLWGEGMTIARAREIYLAISLAGYASENLLIGVGTDMYQKNTRDTFGFAMKATYVEVEESEDGFVTRVSRNITKDPITDNGLKKSAKGLLAVRNGELLEEVTWDDVNSDWNELKLIK